MEARLWEPAERGSRCLVCERGCEIPEGREGICGNYGTREGRLLHLGYGAISAVESRPIEVKPFFHYWPNSTALTFSGYGCNFYCPWCQNNHLSFRKPGKVRNRGLSPERLVEKASMAGDEGLCASFNEPATLFDYLLDVFQLGKQRNLYGTLVTNCYFTPRALKSLMESGVDGFSIDIKGCPSARRALASIDHLKVIRNAKMILDLGGWVEMVYLVVPGFNDEPSCVDWILGKLVDELGTEVPLHVNRYYPAHVWKTPPTPLKTLLEIRRRAVELGLEYVYVGNVGDLELEATRCPECGKKLIVRAGYRVVYYNLDGERCPRCGKRIPMRGRFIPKL